MFTGIIQASGQVIENNQQKIAIGNISDSNFLKDVELGNSIAVNGVCLTVINLDSQSFSVEVMEETLDRTNLGQLIGNDFINLEKALAANGRFEGHIVQGHVDTVVKLQKIVEQKNGKLFYFSLPKEFRAYLVPKGSIALNGISLTLIEVTEDYFSVGIIPHTWENTNLKNLKIRDDVNMETDVLGKYLIR